jgi:hypothetical protein
VASGRQYFWSLLWIHGLLDTAVASCVSGYAVLQGSATHTGHFIRAANLRENNDPPVQQPTEIHLALSSAHASLYKLT